MKILFNSYIPFGARKEEIRKADDIQRKSHNDFPMVSSTKIDFYSCDSENNLKNGVQKKLYSKICDMRNNLEDRGYTEDWDDCENYENTLLAVADKNIGNCGECAKAVIGVLAANGFYNSSRVILQSKIKFIDKTTGETEYEDISDLDHSFVLTDLNSRNEKDIVIDSWLGFADYKSNAATMFKTIFSKDLEEQERKSIKHFQMIKQRKGEEFNIDDYEIKREFVFIPCDGGGYNTWKRLGEHVKKIYPQVVLDVII